MKILQTTHRRRRWLAGPILVAVGVALSACATPPVDEAKPNQTTTAPLSDALAFRDGDPAIEVISPQDGATVVSPFLIEVETSNLQLRPAGTTRDGEGHLHVLIDQGCVEPGVVIEASEYAVHGGHGGNSILVELPPGRHELCTQIGDGFHVAVAISDRIVVNVVEDVDEGP